MDYGFKGCVSMDCRCKDVLGWTVNVRVCLWTVDVRVC